MNKILLARIISGLFNPILFFFLMPYIVVYHQTADMPSSIKWGIFSSLFISIGLVLLLVGRLRGVFSDRDLSIKEEREEFYLIALILSLSYLMFSAFFKGFFFHFSIVSLGIFLGILVFTFINLYTKASIHIAAACGFVLTISIFYGLQVFIALFWVIPLVAWSRIKLHMHTPKEILIGGLLGSLITLLTFIIAKQIL